MKRCSGVTLVELLVVITIIGIITAVALPSYRAQALRANRIEAKVALQQATQVLEKCFTRTRSYATCAAQVAIGDIPGKLYKITILPAEISATAYIVRATANAKQGDDSNCSVLTINQAGARTPAAPDPNRCW